MPGVGQNLHPFTGKGDVFQMSEKFSSGPENSKQTNKASPLSRVDPLACHTCCDTWRPFIMAISKCGTHSYFRSFCIGVVNTYFYDLDLSRLGFDHPSFCLRGNALTDCPTAAQNELTGENACTVNEHIVVILMYSWILNH